MKLRISTLKSLRMNLFFVSMLFVFFASTIKPTESFFDGDDRFYYGIIGVIASFSANLFVCSISIMFFFIVYTLFRKFKAINVGFSIVCFVVLKVWIVLIYIFYGILEASHVLSLFTVIIVSIFCVQWHAQGKDLISDVLNSMAVFSLLFVIANFYQYLTNLESSVWGMRMYGVTNHPNFLGGYSMILLPFLFAWCLNSGKFKFMLGFLGSVGLISLIFMSGSRSSLGALLIVLLSFGVVSGKTRYTIAIIIFLGFLLFSLAILDVGGVSQTLGFERLLLTDNTREYVTFELMSTFSENILFGNPLSVGSTANSYLSAAARTGIIGLLLLICSVVVTLLLAVKNNGYEKPYAKAAVVSSLLGFILYSGFEGVLMENFSFGQIYYILMISVVSLVKNKVRSV